MLQQKASISVSATRMLMLAPHLDNELHRHAVLQFTFSLEGKTFLVRAGAEEWKETTAVIVNSNVPHALRNFTGWQCTCCIIPAVLQGRSLQKNLLKDQAVYFPPATVVSSIIAGLDHFTGLPVISSEDFRQITDHIYNSLLHKPVLQKPPDARITQTLQYIRTHAAENISAAELAAKQHLSEDRFLHLFKENTGAPLRQYIIWQRVAQAFKLFLSGKSLKEAAYEAGFSDPAHFTRTFVQLNGIQPSVYASMKQHYDFNFFPEE